MRVVAWTFLVWLVGVSPVLADVCELSKDTLAESAVSVSATPDGLNLSIEVLAFMPFNIYVVHSGFDAGLQGFDLALSAPPAFILISAQILDGAQNLGDGTSGNFIADLGRCVTTPTTVLVVANYGYFQAPTIPSDAFFCLAPTASSPIAGHPVYVDCSGTPRAMVPLDADCYPGLPDGCLVLNPTEHEPCPTREESFGGVKARFQ